MFPGMLPCVGFHDIVATLLIFNRVITDVRILKISILPLRPNNTKNIFVQLMAQHCCIASWTSCFSYYHRVFNLPRNKFHVASWKKFVAKSRTRVNFAQHISATCNTEICCVASWTRGGNTSNNSFNVFNLQRNNQVLRDKLNENVARITWPLVWLLIALPVEIFPYVVMTVSICVSYMFST